ncbi:MAG: sensor histidine kinase [Bacteroidales bacterium]
MEDWKDPQTFAIGLAIVIFIVLFLGALIVVILRLYTRRVLKEQKEQARLKIQHQKLLAKASVDMREKERARIAADLHDDLVGRLRAIHLMMSMPEKSYEKRPEDHLSETIELTRHISHDLMPPMIEQSDMRELVEEACFILKEKHDVRLNFLNHNEKEPDASLKLQLFRIIKEVVNNIIKHAVADKVELVYRQGNDSISIVIRDNGIGFPENNPGNGLGLKDIELRTQYLNGYYKFANNCNGGSRFILYISV